ncbi:MAG: ATP-binding protein [Bacteroidales bacterium]|nr:ATP-binding protein [Bacteroidales bacterium]MCR5190507.1 ATP-binding protein [Bacteroidales bacterium]
MKDISMHIMDILQNSIRAKADLVQLNVTEDHTADTLTLEFIDNGTGMSEDTLANVLNPFFTTRTTRKVGLGLSLLKQNAEQTGGHLEIASKLGEGTTVKAVFGLSHWDRQPMGDLPGTLILTVSAHPEIRFIFRYKSETIDFVFDTDEVNEVLEGASLQDPSIIQDLKELVEANLEGRVE